MNLYNTDSPLLSSSLRHLLGQGDYLSKWVSPQEDPLLRMNINLQQRDLGRLLFVLHFPSLRNVHSIDCPDSDCVGSLWKIKPIYRVNTQYEYGRG